MHRKLILATALVLTISGKSNAEASSRFWGEWQADTIKSEIGLSIPWGVYCPKHGEPKPVLPLKCQLNGILFTVVLDEAISSEEAFRLNEITHSGVWLAQTGTGDDDNTARLFRWSDLRGKIECKATVIEYVKGSEILDAISVCNIYPSYLKASDHPLRITFRKVNSQLRENDDPFVPDDQYLLEVSYIAVGFL